MSRICFLNPFGTDAYDDLIAAPLRPSLRDATEVEIRHLAHAPRDIDYYASKHLAETEIMAAAVAAERRGVRRLRDRLLLRPRPHAVPGAGRHPGGRPARGLRAAVAAVRALASPCSPTTTRRSPSCATASGSTAWRRAAGPSTPSTGSSTTWSSIPRPSPRTPTPRCEDVMRTTGAETVVIGCTIVSACYELAALERRPTLAALSVVNPNLMAVKLAELFVDLRASGQYRMSRSGLLPAARRARSGAGRRHQGAPHRARRDGVRRRRWGAA